MRALHAFFYRRHWWYSSHHPVVSSLAFEAVGLIPSTGQVYGKGHQHCVPPLLPKTKFISPNLNANWGLAIGLKSGMPKSDSNKRLASPTSQPDMMRYDRKKDKSTCQLSGKNTPLQVGKDKEYESLPLWVRNQKLLGKIFIVWVVLVVFMLLNVFRVIDLF